MIELTRKSVHELCDLLHKKEVSAVELARAYENRIEEVEERVRAYITLVSPEKNAEAIDKRRASGEELPRLAGIPYALKDNICTNGVLTTCASKMLYNFVPPYSAAVADKLDEHGAVLLGKTNMDEFAMGSTTESSYYGATRNPHCLSRVPGGSSGGSAAAVAACEAAFALGTDTGGSIRQPSSHCGVVGLKPTYGRISRHGVVAFASSLDQVGPVTRDVRDAAIVLGAISGRDARDATTIDAPPPDYESTLEDGVKGLRIGLPKEYFGQGISTSVRDAVMRAAEKLEAMGAIVGECSLPRSQEALASYYMISCAEASSNMGKYDGVEFGYRAENYSDINDLIVRSRSESFGAEVKRRIMTGVYALSAGYYDAYYKRAQQLRTLIINDFNRVYEDFDLLLTPSCPTTAWEFGGVTDPLELYAADICTVPVNVAGLAAISVPCALDEASLPIGAHIIAPFLGESTMLRAAYAVEQACGRFSAPL